MVHLRRRAGSILSCCLLLLLFSGHVAVTRAAGPERIIPNPRDQQRIQEIVDQFMGKLTMTYKVAVAVVPKNPLMVSVEYTDTSTGFLLSVEEDFINELTRKSSRRPSHTSSGTCGSSRTIHSFKPRCWRIRSHNASCRAPVWCTSTKKCGSARAPKAISPGSSATRTDGPAKAGHYTVTFRPRRPLP